MRLLKAKSEDIAALVEIINHAYSYQDKAKGSPRTSFEHLSKRMEEVDFYLAKESDEITGCFYIEDKKPSLHFGLLTVIDEYRGKGLAQAMMSVIESYAKSYGYNNIELDYMSLAPWLKNYYEKYGFKETGGVIKWGSIDLINMAKTI